MAAKNYPTFADYQAALQHPKYAFQRIFLRDCDIEKDLWGIPRVRSGGFALTYKVLTKEGHLAARCFHRAVRDRAARYSLLSRVIESSKLPFLLPTRYYHNGIVVKGKPYPITTLEWIDGDSLENYIMRNLEDSETLQKLCLDFQVVCMKLDQAGIAQGDLSHRNILIKDKSIYLIDYDGMYIPGFKGKNSTELGNIHFQHPSRTTLDFNSHLDRFSSIVIYLAIQSLVVKPSLWQQFQTGGEGLLFTQSDFINPENSKLLAELENSGSLSGIISKFKRICKSGMDSIPSLENFIQGKENEQFLNPIEINLTAKNIQKGVPLVDAWSLDWIRRSEGQTISVFGRVTEIFHGTSIEGDEHIFVNFGDWTEKCFTAVIWGEILLDMNRFDFQLQFWPGKWFMVTGLISIFNNRPQIQLESITDILPIQSENEAQSLFENAQREGRYKAPPGKLNDSDNLPVRQTEENQNIADIRKSSKKAAETFQKFTDEKVSNKIDQLYSNRNFKAYRN